MILDFCDYMNDAIRILVLLNNVKLKKLSKMSEFKIKLFDYYLKFPYTMMEEKAEEYGFEESIDEYYSFFHWQPDLIKYRQALNYLIAKGFIIKNDESFYQITEIGIEALQKIENDYLIKLNSFCAKCVIPRIYNLSEKKIDEEIKLKANIITLRGLVK